MGPIGFFLNTSISQDEEGFFMIISLTGQYLHTLFALFQGADGRGPDRSAQVERHRGDHAALKSELQLGRHVMELWWA